MELLPDPDTPVTTEIEPAGMSTFKSFRLWVAAPLIEIAEDGCSSSSLSTMAFFLSNLADACVEA